MSSLSNVIKKNKKLVNEILTYLKPVIIKKIEKELKGKITESALLVMIKFIEDLEV